MWRQKNAIVSGSERASAFFKEQNFREKADNLKLIQNNPYVAFEKDFLRWMLSDGAAATLLQNEPTPNYQDNTPPLIRGGTLKERVKI